MSLFVVAFIGLFSAVLIMAPLIWRLLSENAEFLEVINTARLDMAETLRQSDNYRLACEHASDGLVIQDMRGIVLWCNPAYCEMHRRPKDAIIGRNPLEFALPKDQALRTDEIQAKPFDVAEGKLYRSINENGDGELFWIELSASFHRTSDGREVAIVVSREVTEKAEKERQLRDIRDQLSHQATHDGLTNIANRAAFLAFMQDTLAEGSPAAVGLLHIDLDNFKDVNDTHGHSAGDALLCHAARIISDGIAPTDLVARVGGDEFVVVRPNAPDLKSLDQLGRHLLREIATPLKWKNRNLQIESSIGAALSLPGQSDPEELLVHADLALYEAKRAGRNRVVLYDETLHELQAFQNRRAADLAKAISDGKLAYHFQPTLALETGDIAGFECLVRWPHPQDGMIPPDQFLPMVAELGLMAELDLLSMTAALAEKRKLNLAGFTDVKIAFNASPELLDHPDFVNRLVWGVEASGVRREHVTIEVLETTDFGDAAQKCSHAAIIRDLRIAGFQVHLDDFGIGFAGLSHLAELDVSGVKIDRGLIKNLLTDDVSRKIVRHIVELSNDLGLTVIAEGVEDQQTAAVLRDMECGIIQGYWLSRPLPVEDLYGWLAARDRTPKPRRA